MTIQHTTVPRFNVHTAAFDPSPEYNGWKKFLYESADGSRRVGSFKETGVFDVVMPCDEFIFVVAGQSTVSVEGGETFELTPGDCCYLRKGLSVTFNHGPDFHDVAVLMTHDDESHTV